MRIEIDKEDYKNLIETQEEFIKTVKKLENIIIENIKLKDKFQAKEQKCENYKQALDEIEKIANKREAFCEHCSNDDDDFSCEDCGYCKILNIINKTKEQ